MYRPNLKSVGIALPVYSEIICTEVANPSLGEEEAIRGRG